MKKNKENTNKTQPENLQRFRDELENYLKDVLDPRSQDNTKYSFNSLMGIILCGIISGANSITAIHEYAVSKKEWLSMWLDLPDDVPGYSVFWYRKFKSYF